MCASGRRATDSEQTTQVLDSHGCGFRQDLLLAVFVTLFIANCTATSVVSLLDIALFLSFAASLQFLSRVYCAWYSHIDTTVAFAGEGCAYLPQVQWQYLE